jgi:hypothetical protein
LDVTCSFVLDRVCLAVEVGTQAGPGQLLLYRRKVDAPSQAKEPDGARKTPAKTVAATDNDAKRLARPVNPSIPGVVASAVVTKRKLFMRFVPTGLLRRLVHCHRSSTVTAVP